MWELTIKDGVVYSRSKARLAADSPWSASVQIFPHRSTPHFKPHAPEVVPGIASAKEWTFLDLVKKDLTKFYADTMDFTVADIPADVSKRAYHPYPYP